MYSFCMKIPKEMTWIIASPLAAIISVLICLTNWHDASLSFNHSYRALRVKMTKRPITMSVVKWKMG